MIDDMFSIESSNKKLRDFGLLVGFVLHIIGALLFWSGTDGFLFIFITIGILFIFVSVTVPATLKPVYSIWMTVGIILGWIMTRLILGMLFYLVFTSTRLIATIFGKRFLLLQKDCSTSSYWKFRKTRSTKKEDYERQF